MGFKRAITRTARALLAALLVFALAFALVVPSVTLGTAYAAGVENPWDGVSMEQPQTDSDGTYLIYTAAQLAWFANEVNGGSGQINARLMDYIYLNSYNTDHAWTPIGATLETPYAGTFDGNGKSVIYMRVGIDSSKSPQYRYAGLFGVVDGGTVKNVTVLGRVTVSYATENTDAAQDITYTASGGIAGYLKDGIISECVNYARTICDGNAQYRNSGGIAGICSGLITNCENHGKITLLTQFAQYGVGGIAGLAQGVYANITNCVNYANINGYMLVGGVAGYVRGGARISYSCNYGDIKAADTAGGIAGMVTTRGQYTNGTTQECSITYVYNLGTLKAVSGSSCDNSGGIVGKAFYEEYSNPQSPVVEYGYSAADFEVSSAAKYVGGVAGNFQCGEYGYLYAKKCVVNGSQLNAVSAQDSSMNPKKVGTVAMMSEDAMKDESFVTTLGSAFAMSTAYDEENNGYPKLAWQALPSDLMHLLAEARTELASWLTDANMSKYGKTYSDIESICNEYTEKLQSVTTQAQLEQIMLQAREALAAVKPGAEADTELAQTIDNALISLEEYTKKTISEHTELNDSDIANINSLCATWSAKIELATSVDDVRLLLRDAKDDIDSEIASLEENLRIEEKRTAALLELQNYRTNEVLEAVWAAKIKITREDYLGLIRAAQSVADITSLLSEAESAIDAIIDDAPESGAWDGSTRKEPATDDAGVYQITSPEELAWFADAVNSGNTAISAYLCNDISLGSNNWTPIGHENVFTGSFDGGGHTIRRLKLDLTKGYVGLFGRVGGGSISNLTVSGQISVENGIYYVGAIAAYVCGTSDSRPVIANCHNNVNMTVATPSLLDAGIGGVTGYAENAEITHCSNNGTIVLSKEGAGGKDTYTGGLVGMAADGTRIYSCYSAGTVQSEQNAGGLIGGIQGADVSVTSCYSCSEVSGRLYAGGLIGMVLDADTTKTIATCYSSGPVNLSISGKCAGALFGYVNTAQYDALLALKRSDSISLALIGDSRDSTVPGRFVTESELKGDDVLNTLNGRGSDFIRDYMSSRGGYPILEWELTVEKYKTGAIADIRSYASEDDYTQENWEKVTAIMDNGENEIMAATDMDGINSLVTRIKEEIDAIESKEASRQKALTDAQEEAIALLDNYVNLEDYRDEEQTEIKTIISDAKRYILLADTVDEVERHSQEARAKIDRLPNAMQYLQQQWAKDAELCDSLISGIGEVVYADYCKLNIELARTAYDGLSEEARELVTKYDVLVAAEQAWEELANKYHYTQEDEDAAAAVDKIIEEIGTVTKDSLEAITRAEAAYASLTDIQKVLVKNYAVLTAARSEYDSLCAADVINAIAAIGDVTLEKKDAINNARNMYDDLTDAQKALVTDYGSLVSKETLLRNMIAAEPVNEMIMALPAYEDITLNDRDAILAAIRAFNALTGDEQECVDKYYILERAASKYDSLERVQSCIDLISSIGGVSLASGNKITAARTAYDALSAEEKGQVTNISVLENAEIAYAALEAQSRTVNSGTSSASGGTASYTASGNSGSVTSSGTSSSGTSSGSVSGGTASSANSSATSSATSAAAGSLGTGTVTSTGSSSAALTTSETSAISSVTQDVAAQAQTQAAYDDASELPEWLQSELDGSDTSDTSLTGLIDDKREGSIQALTVVLIILGCVTACVALYMWLSKRQRDRRKVRFNT